MTNAWSGRPTLAALDPADIPAVDSDDALDGLRAGFDAALKLSAHHDQVGQHEFYAAVIDARRSPRHGYRWSREFLAGVQLAAAELRNISGGRA